MSRKNTLVTPIAIGQSLASSFTSDATIVRYLDNCSYQINVSTSDSTGTFDIEVSNDYSVNEGNGSVVTNTGQWTSLTLAGGTPFVNATNDTIIINLNQLPFYAMRVKYTSTIAGTGTCSIYLVAKQIGG